MRAPLRSGRARLRAFAARANTGLPRDGGALARGVRALHVEVGPENDTARRPYARAGYVESGHLFLRLPLAAPVHAG